jgi:hypothetical protein
MTQKYIKRLHQRKRLEQGTERRRSCGGGLSMGGGGEELEEDYTQQM